MGRHRLPQILNEVTHGAVNAAIDIAQELLIQLGDVHANLEAGAETATAGIGGLAHRLCGLLGLDLRVLLLDLRTGHRVRVVGFRVLNARV